MGTATFTKVWSFLGLATLILSINGLLLSQGAAFSFSFGAKLDEQGPYTASLYSLGLTLPIFILFLLTTHTYLYKFPGSSWATKFPFAFDIQYEKLSLDVKIYQAIFIFLFLIVSLYSVSHLYNKFLSGTAYQVKNEALVTLTEPQKITHAKIDHLFNDHWGLVNERYKYMCEPCTQCKCKGGMSYYPLVLPWTLLLLVLICYLLIIDAFMALFRQKHLTKWVYVKLANRSVCTPKQTSQDIPEAEDKQISPPIVENTKDDQ